jgi:hypothetical protein
MKIKWDKKPATTEQKILADYLISRPDIITDVVRLSSRHDVLSASITPKSFESGFFTYEFKKDPSSDSYLIIIWKGIRTGDAVPVLYGHLEEETTDIKEHGNRK